MVLVRKSVKCPVCGNEMTSYTINNMTSKISFTCSKNSTHVKELTESEYLREIKNNGH